MPDTLVDSAIPAVDTSFVISPFGEPFDTYFSHIVKPALEECGLYAIRGDSLYRPTTIVDDIWQGIQQAKLLVAELTDRNPNVFYELGLAHAISKPVILIAKSIEDVPFDLRSIRVLVYDKDHPDWGAKLRLSLTKAIKEVLHNPTSAIPSTFKIAIKPVVPEEAETAMRLEALETMVQRITDGLGAESVSTYAEKSEHYMPDGMRPGANVFSPKFGPGKVLSLEGKGDDLKAQINFDRHGVKWMALRIAKLAVLPD
ncbi:hypothetical protein [Paraburkholderia sp. C35]|uniref:hypothetical protein n=1 Tax=Paraburkholderia sp. C35 TaxID=2126993 RepID=UPI000D68B58B|nr:hypothetical protein [Paraburkholderia sp. C35]